MKKKKKTGWKYGFDHTTGDGQKRLMAVSVGDDSERWIGKPLIIRSEGDYGADPLETGMFRMVPSGDIVDYTERVRRLERRK